MAVTSIEIGNNDTIVITKNGTVVGFVKVKRERENAIELVANPVNIYNWEIPSNLHTFNSFSTTLSTQVDSPEDIASVENFIAALNA